MIRQAAKFSKTCHHGKPQCSNRRKRKKGLIEVSLEY